ncbi:MAG: inositol monophosphatase family protein [Promethearchaeota archaeon]
MYVAKSGKGVTRNGRPVEVSEPIETGNAIISYDTKKEWDAAFASGSIRVLQAVHDSRRTASNLLDLCWVAAGSLDAMVDMRDILPVVHVSGTHMVQEAGGCILDKSGYRLCLPLDLNRRMSFVAASDEFLARAILRAFHGE